MSLAVASAAGRARAPRRPGTAARPRGADALRIGGLVPLTSIDYPGELACVVFCHGCPWRCRYCHNAHLLDATADSALDWAEVRAFLRHRRGLLDAVVFSGGEPTAQAALLPAIEEARALGFKIGLHTAGPYPERLAPLLPLVDWVGLDIKGLPGDYPAITGVAGSGERAWESLGLVCPSASPDAVTTPAIEVRTTLLPDWDIAHLGDLADALAGAGVTDWVLQRLRADRALDPTLGPGRGTRRSEVEAAGLDRRFRRLAFR